MLCKCGGKTSVLQTFTLPEGIKRRRKCKCGVLTYTLETVIKHKEPTPEEVNKIQQFIVNDNSPDWLKRINNKLCDSTF
jgi:hypothetical protein